MFKDQNFSGHKNNVLGKKKKMFIIKFEIFDLM